MNLRRRQPKFRCNLFLRQTLFGKQQYLTQLYFTFSAFMCLKELLSCRPVVAKIFMDIIAYIFISIYYG